VVEMINGDSLSGLLTTVGFFIMLIVGRRVRMRHTASRAQLVKPQWLRRKI
jgi:hypothetical protein